MKKSSQSPMALFESGIKQRSWPPVIQAFNAMFGYTPESDAVETGMDDERLKSLTVELFELIHGKTSAEKVKASKPSAVKRPPAKVARKPKKAPLAVFEAEHTDDDDEAEDDLTDDSTKKRLVNTRRKIQRVKKPVDVADEDDEDDEDISPDDDGGGGGDIQCQRRPFRKPKGGNQFKDDGKIAAHLIGQSKKLSKKATPKTYRGEPVMVLKKCSLCGRKEKVPPIAVEGIYRCNSCIRGA